MTHHEAGAGPEHGPAHRGDAGSPEPGGFDEFVHVRETASPGQVADPAADIRDHGDDVLIAAAEAQAGIADDDLPSGPAGEAPFSPADDGAPQPGAEAPPLAAEGALAAADLGDPAQLAAERLEDLRRLQAEYVNYKKRVDRDRMLAREQGISSTLESLLPVLDDIHLAREHGDLSGGPLAAIIEKLESVLARLGIERFGSAGEQFDPVHHDALMHVEAALDPGATTTTVVQVLQPGYRLGDRVVRAARVAVADPQ